MSFEHIQGQEQAIGFLKSLVQTGNIPSALLFCGMPHVGKATTAKALVQALNCQNSENKPCLTCEHCRQIADDSFPDFMEVAPDGKFIKIAQIQKAIQWIQFRPDPNITKTLVIDQAEAMNLESVNAFLKTLEEPPPNTLCLLLASQRSALPETILSRCQTVRFKPLSKNTIQCLLQQAGASQEESQFASQFAMGSLNQHWVSNQNELKELRHFLLELLTQNSLESFTALFQNSDKWGAKDGVWSDVLDLVESILRDLLWLIQTQDTAGLLHIDCLEELAKCHFSQERLLELYEALQWTRSNIKSGANVPLALDSFWIQLGT